MVSINLRQRNEGQRREPEYDSLSKESKYHAFLETQVRREHIPQVQAMYTVTVDRLDFETALYVIDAFINQMLCLLHLQRGLWRWLSRIGV